MKLFWSAHVGADILCNLCDDLDAPAPACMHRLRPVDSEHISSDSTFIITWLATSQYIILPAMGTCICMDHNVSLSKEVEQIELLKDLLGSSVASMLRMRVRLLVNVTLLVIHTSHEKRVKVSRAAGVVTTENIFTHARRACPGNSVCTIPWKGKRRPTLTTPTD
uniref:Uncharacterized protein n=1 Tax=Aegilops tauschii subsp. strangulata TaxID=200361 RepID=A0A453RPX8_AEGTS